MKGRGKSSDEVDAPNDSTTNLFQSELRIFGSPERALSQKIRIWANGASDHLYEIGVPQELELTELGRKVAELRELGLTMGHGFREREVYTMKHVEKLRSLVKEISLEIDRRLGLDGDWGQW